MVTTRKEGEEIASIDGRCVLLMGALSGTSAVKTVWHFFKMLNRITQGPTILLAGIHSWD